MIKQILFGYVRHGLTAGAGYLLSHGLIDQSGAQVLASAMLAIAGVAWSTIEKMLANYDQETMQRGK